MLGTYVLFSTSCHFSVTIILKFLKTKKTKEVVQSRDVIVYICGGVTYEESFHIYRLNKELQG